ncbi:23S rRNA (adenine(2503)-C(2))-methyltransferase RlmN [soil metagenome]
MTEVSDPITVKGMPGRRGVPTTFFDLSLTELTDRLQRDGQPAYRARQIYQWAYQRRIESYDQMTTLPASLRSQLATTVPFDALTIEQVYEADDGETLKILYRTPDDQLVETVLMFYEDRVTVCVSCQVGCAVGCSFCATGIGGLQRNLTAGEMAAQVVDAARRSDARGRKLSNLVMMGMGEPFHNYAETLKFIRVINDQHGMGFGARRITISTSGIIPGINKLAEEPLQVNLAVSLHSSNDALRSTLVPINHRFPVQDLMRACDQYIAKTSRRISFEYALMKGINSDHETARELATLLRGRLCHVNIIPFNPVDMLPFERPAEADIERFAQILRDGGIPVSVRYSRGLEIAAACGQLRARHLEVPNT